MTPSIEGWHLAPLAAPLLVGAVLMLAIAGFALRSPRVRGSGWLALLAVALSVYALGYAAELGSPSLAAVRLCLAVQYLGVANVPVLVLLVALAATGRGRYVSPLSVALLLALPLTTCVLAASDAGRELLWRDLTVDVSAGFTKTRFEPGPWYRVHNAYAQLLLLTALGVVAAALRGAKGVFRRQLQLLLVGMLVPIGVHIAYLAGWAGHGLDPNPYAQILAAAILAWAILETQFLDLVPVAHDALIASQRDAMLVVDAGGRLIELNPAAQTVFGVSAAQAIGRPVEELLPGWGPLARSRNAGESFRAPLTRAAAGEEHSYDVGVSPLATPGGRVEGRLLVLRDVTQRRRAEQLQDTLVKTMVHDLRNPLTVVSAALEMLAHEQPPDAPESARSLLEMARANTHRLIDLVTGILDFHRLRSGKMPLRCVPLDVSTLVAEALELQRPLAEAKGQRLQPELDPALPPLEADRELVARVLQNLIGNALKFSPRGGTVRVSARAADAGRDVAFAVADDGPGIPRELQGRLFSEFVTGTDARGSGLGLAFCRLAVEAHGGTVGVQSEAGLGTTLVFTLPALSATRPVETAG